MTRRTSGIEPAALIRSTSNRSWGTFAENVVKTPASSGRFPGRLQELVGDGRRRLDPLALAVLDHEVEAAGGAEALDRRRLEDRRPRLDDLLGEPALEVRRQAGGPQPGARSGGASPRG